MIEELVKKGLLAKNPLDIKKAQKSIELAENRIEKAQEEMAAELFDDVLISAYTSMFHASRALLFKDGYKERSHYALCEYIREKYSGKLEAKYINELNILRTIRHKLIYGDEELNLKEIQETEANDGAKLAEGYLSAVKKLLTK